MNDTVNINQLSPELQALVKKELAAKSSGLPYTHIHMLLDRSGSMDSLKSLEPNALVAWFGSNATAHGTVAPFPKLRTEGCSFPITRASMDSPFNLKHTTKH